MRPAIPDDVRQFVVLAVPSVPYLEALLLMRRSAPATWSAAALAASLYLNDKDASALISRLLQAGVAQRGGDALRYAPPPAVAALIDRLAEVYADNLIGVSMLIHAAGAPPREASRLRDGGVDE